MKLSKTPPLSSPKTPYNQGQIAPQQRNGKNINPPNPTNPNNTPPPNKGITGWLYQQLDRVPHTKFATKSSWLLPLLVPAIHLPLDKPEDRWSLFWRDEIAVGIGAGIYMLTHKLLHKAFNHLGLLKNNAPKKEFIAYALGHSLAIAHGAFTAMAASRWLDKVVFNPNNPKQPLQQRIKNAFKAATKPKQNKTQPTTTPIPKAKTPTQTKTKNPSSTITTSPKLSSLSTTKTTPSLPISFSTPTNYYQANHKNNTTQQRTGTQKPKTQWQTTLKTIITETLGTNPWEQAQLLSNFYAGSLLIPLLRYPQYAPTETNPQKRKTKQKELAWRDFCVMAGGSTFFFAAKATTSYYLQKHPALAQQWSQNAIKNLSYLIADTAKTLNAGLLAIATSQLITNHKTTKNLKKNHNTTTQHNNQHKIHHN